MVRCWLFAVLIAWFPVAAGAAEYVDSGFFANEVAAGKLPPVAERLPSTPLVVVLDGDRAPGRHGGDLNMLMARSKDVRMMVVYGYARLVKYSRDLSLEPDLLERIDVEEGRIFTLYLRPGHRWSDGAPFTAGDFRYYWRDVANNRELSPAGPPVALRAGGALPKFEVLDQTTVRYSWPVPNPGFLPALAAARPLFLYRPAHYLKQFHASYGDRAALDARARKVGQRNWAAQHNRLDNMYKNNNVDLPTLQPWVNITRGPAERFVFERNAYYHKVDSAGLQLPYIDRVIMQIASAKIIPAKTGTGESDLQARYLRFDNFSFLKKNEERNGFRTLLWRIAKGSHLTLYPNLNAADPVWRKLLRDRRFRRALSLAIDRREINQVIYFGLALPGQNTMLPDSPLFRPDYRDAWAQFDTRRANRLLDEIGLRKRRGGVRLMADGRKLEIIVESAGGTEEADALSLIRDSWAKIGIRLHIKPLQRDVARNRIYSGATVMSIWSGYENGLATADTVPVELAPTRQIQYQWPKWGQYAETSGLSGEPPDIKEARRLLELLAQWYKSATRERREAVWREMLAINAEQLFTIGIISGVMQPVVVDRLLRNVPETGLYNWNPGAHFGLYEPDSFWFAEAGKG
jgi:peptide/nickel transport system substrate-binding protein